MSKHDDYYTTVLWRENFLTNSIHDPNILLRTIQLFEYKVLRNIRCYTQKYSLPVDLFIDWYPNIKVFHALLVYTELYVRSLVVKHPILFCVETWWLLYYEGKISSQTVIVCESSTVSKAHHLSNDDDGPRDLSPSPLIQKLRLIVRFTIKCTRNILLIFFYR